MDLLKTVFGIDVSSRKSNVCIMVNGQKVNDYAISNDMVGFNQLLDDLKQVTNPQIIFEATGVYSRRLQTFLNMHELRYVMMNPLEAKRKTKDDLHQNKTDKLDAMYLAKLQSEHPQRLAYVQSEEYQELMANNRIYEQASHDLITNKNRLHKAIQLTFPEIEHVMATPRGKNYWSIVLRFPHPDIVLETKEADIIDFLKSLSGIGKKRANDIMQKLIRLAKVACPAVKKDSAYVHGLKIAINNILSAEEECQTALQEMAKLAPKRDLEILTSIPGIGENTALRIISELGDIRRFKNPNQLNAFVGVDLKFINLATSRPTCQFQSVGQLSAERCCTWQSTKFNRPRKQATLAILRIITRNENGLLRLQVTRRPLSHRSINYYGRSSL